MFKQYALHKTKGQAPIIAIFSIFSLAISLYLFPKILFFSFLIFPLMAVIYLLLAKYKIGLFKRKCFFITDDEGIKYCFHLLQTPVFIAWHLIEKVNFQIYEINLTVKGVNGIVNIQTNYFTNKEEVTFLKQEIKRRIELNKEQITQ